MLAEFLARLAVALPLVCALAVLCLVAVKRGWVRLPGFAAPSRPPGTGRSGALPAEALLSVAAVKSLTPSTRVAVVRFAGRDHLVGICGASVQLLATSMPEPPPPPAIDAESAA